MHWVLPHHSVNMHGNKQRLSCAPNRAHVAWSFQHRRHCRAKAYADQPRVLFQASTQYNPMLNVIEVPEGAPQLGGARLLQLDASGNIHSLYKPGLTHTMAYWDILATLPGMTPQGPMAILGLVGFGASSGLHGGRVRNVSKVFKHGKGAFVCQQGAGTLAQIVHTHNPQQQMSGWELDPAVIHAARMFMGMQQLEDTGALSAHTGNALALGPQHSGSFTSVAVDIFQDGVLPSELTQGDVWRSLATLLQPQPGCRIMANLGHAPLSQKDIADNYMMMSPQHRLGQYRAMQAMQAMLKVFGEGQVSVLCARNLEGSEHDSNCMAVTGPSERFQEQWQASLPHHLQYLSAKYTWVKCEDLLATL